MIKLNEVIRKIDDEYFEKIMFIDNGEIFRDLKILISIFNEKNRELNNFCVLIERYDIVERDKKIFEGEKVVLIVDLDEEFY